MLQRLDALLAQVQADAGARSADQSLRMPAGWEPVAAAAVILVCLIYAVCKLASSLYAANSVGGRARTLMDLSNALDQGGSEAAVQLADAAGVAPRTVYEWHAAWKIAWRGPG